MRFNCLRLYWLIRYGMFLVSEWCCSYADGPIVQQQADRMQAARGTCGSDVESHAESDRRYDVGLLGALQVFLGMLSAIVI